METRIKTTVYAKNLRARLTELRTEYEAAKKKYGADLLAWRLSLKNWIKTYGSGRVDSITRELEYRYRGTQGFDTQISSPVHRSRPPTRATLASAPCRRRFTTSRSPGRPR